MSKSKHCPGCCDPGRQLPITNFYKRRDSPDGYESKCSDCRDKRSKAQKSDKLDDNADKILQAAADRATRMADRRAPLTADDLYDVSVGNVAGDGKVSAQASKEKRQEFNRKMGDHADALTRAANSAHTRGGDVLSMMPGDVGAYIGALAEQELRFGNRRAARSVALAQAAEAMSLQAFQQIARQFFADKITATGFGTKKPSKPAKRTVCLLLSDLHLGSELSSLDEPMPFGAVQEARRLEYILRQTVDYKPQYRTNTKLKLLINGDVIEGQLMHQIGAGAPLAEQKAIFWSYFRRFIAELSRAFPQVDIHFQPGNHGRDKVRHPGRATWRKWDGHEWEMYFALAQMCSGLANVTCDLPFRAVSLIDLHGQNLLLTHADTEIKLGHPDGAAKANAREFDRCNATEMFGGTFTAVALGHFHSGRAIYGDVIQLWNGALVPPNGHARASGYIGEAMGQFLWEAVPGFPVGDVRFIKVGAAQDNDSNLGKIIKPFRFPSE